MKHTLPGQLDMPAYELDAGHAQRLASVPLKPNKPQLPCDRGLFSDDAAQVDLVDLIAKSKPATLIVAVAIAIGAIANTAAIAVAIVC
jgi:hypothetical protein